MSKHIFAGVIVALMLGAPTWGALVIDVGDYPLLENTSGQTVNISISGGDSVAGMTFRAQIADGYSAVPGETIPGSSIDGPDFEGVDAISGGMVFAGGNQTDVVAWEQAWESNVSTSSGTVSGSGLLATLTIDTTGHFLTDSVTSWALDLEGMVFGDTEFTGAGAVEVPVTIANGTIYLDAGVIPEPGVVVQLLGLGGAGVFLLWLRRRKRRAA
jgi:hypothetical protein